MDLACSLILTGVFNVGSWVVYKSFNGIQYVYKRVRPDQLHNEYTLDELNSPLLLLLPKKNMMH